MSLDDQSFDIDSRIEYVDCKPGDPKGLLVVNFNFHGRQVAKTVRWKAPCKNEADAIVEMTNFLANFV